MTRAEILQAAAEIITKDREQQYGKPEDNFSFIANLWDMYRAASGIRKMRGGIDAHDVAMMMCLLKIARIATGEPKADNYIDLAGYAACAAEIATKHDAPAKHEPDDYSTDFRED